ncbi:Receptor-like kinase [Quillaja saponaria]|uniref:non-specific serine/threonine protein kinase n=1 Tax=Quillaja saponaria TaxID=32244 RepID=A0AAD7M5H3_QUISA|nr:Receptor-like kinase [Quillaja saponaria]
MENTHLFLSSIIIISSFLLTNLPPSHGRDDELYTVCNRPFQCGNITNMLYPFYGNDRPRDCGSSVFELDCKDNQYPVIEINSLQYRVLKINNQNYTMTLAREDLLESTCPTSFLQTRMNTSYFEYATPVRNLTIYYGCPPGIIHPGNNFTCGDGTAYFKDEAQNFPPINFSGCNNSIEVPVIVNPFNGPQGGIDALERALNRGFDVQYTADWTNCSVCRGSGGLCGMDSAYQFSCHCHNGTSPSSCQVQVHKKSWAIKTKIIVGSTAAGAGALLTYIIICCFRLKRSTNILAKFGKLTKNEKDIEAFIRKHGPLTVKRYKFSEVKKMTNSFKVELGEGGYGGVYKGKLLTGSPVAVKVLKSSKGNGEDFTNEVASISRTSHVNVVTLLGFCFEDNRKALIYEYMPNGSLEKFIYNKTTSPTLSWENLHQIAIGIARGLEYLHRGCNTRILHFDIKPHNILLDENYCPKISDFGLAKLCTRKDSIISMQDARGTIGYVAPEVWNRNFGGVSHKSDVYSYGMMILEMVGGRKNIYVDASHTSEIYFPHWVYKNLEQGNNLGLHGVVSTLDNEIARKMILVGLRCIQTIPSDRPAISGVIEMLEGKIESLQMPPMPILSSAARSLPDSSAT